MNTTTYTHEEIRAFMADDANGTITEQTLCAIKNLESAIFKRKSINPIEQKALTMILQCADELRAHMADTPVIDRPTPLPRELREGLKRELAEAMLTKSPSRFIASAGDTITDKAGRVWGFNADNRVYRVL